MSLVQASVIRVGDYVNLCLTNNVGKENEEFVEIALSPSSVEILCLALRSAAAIALNLGLDEENGFCIKVDEDAGPS